MRFKNNDLQTIMCSVSPRGVVERIINVRYNYFAIVLGLALGYQESQPGNSGEISNRRNVAHVRFP